MTGEKINDPALDGEKDCFPTNSKTNRAAHRKSLLDFRKYWPPVEKLS